MTDVQVPRGDGSLAGFPQTTVANENYSFCLDILLKHKDLDEHLGTVNPDPSPGQMITIFLQLVDQKLMDVVAEYKDKNKDHTPEKLEDARLRGELTKKVRGLKFYTMKTACHMNWRLDELEKHLTVPVMHKLMSVLLGMTMLEGLDVARRSDLNLSALTGQAAFAVHLYHRWCLRCIVKDTFPQRPIRQNFMVLQGMQDPTFVQTQELIRVMKEEMDMSVLILEKFLEANLELKMPTSECFIPPTMEEDEAIVWDACRTIPAEEITCQTSYTLGIVYFDKMDYNKAFQLFKKAKELYGMFAERVFCVIDEDRLHGYLVSCSSLLGVGMERPPQTLFERAEVCRQNNFQGIVDVFLEDNMKRELSMEYRTNVESEIGRQGSGLATMSLQVCLANVVRGVVEGKALISPLQAMLEHGDTSTTDFLIKALNGVMMSANREQLTNLVCFIKHLAHVAPPESDLIKSLMQAEAVAAAFSQEERLELQDMEDEDDLFLEEVLSQDPSLLSSHPSSRESSYNVSDVESQLLTVYDPSTIRELVLDLCQNRNMHAAHIISLNDKWKVPREIRHNLETLPAGPNTGFQHAYTYVLLGKARHCMDIKVFERARQLLDVADSVIKEASYPLSKHVRWQMLQVDLMQFSFNQSLAPNSSKQDLIKRTKTCLTTIRLAQDIQPSAEMVEHCTTFLLNIEEWDYLANLENIGNSYIELSRMIACVVRDLANIKTNRKPARDFWEKVLPVFQCNTQHKRTSSGRDSTLHRDSQLGILPREAFQAFLLKLKEPSVVTLILSFLTKLFTNTKSDITTEITNDFSGFWPLTVNVSAGMPEAVGDMLNVFVSHALKVNPSQPSWLLIQADIYFAQGEYDSAMKFYMEAGVVSTDYFTVAPSEKLFDDAVYKKMIRCCTYLKCYTQVAVLCQFLREPDYITAFKSLQEKACHDAMDLYYCCIWETPILEILINNHTRRGELDKQQAAIHAMQAMDINQSNPEEIKKRAIHSRKTRFLRALAKQYLV